MIKFNKIIPTLYTQQLHETVDFYCRKLEFECNGYEEKQGWAIVRVGDVEIMITLPNDHLPFKEPVFTGSIYINVTGIEDLWITLKDKAEIAYPIETFDYGMREFALKDNNGYLIQFGENMNNKQGAILSSTITCPNCGYKKEETMPTNSCQYFYECEKCQKVIKPKKGDCCVYCSYGSVPCPPIQENKSCC